ncbi:hypothetical protein ACR2V0_28810, partial [Klebsiella pneumoniae]
DPILASYTNLHMIQQKKRRKITQISESGIIFLFFVISFNILFFPEKNGKKKKKANKQIKKID